MKVILHFELKDFNNFKLFEKSVKNQLGQNCYVGTDSLCLYFDYPKELKEMLRPYPPETNLNFLLDSDKR